MSEPKARGRVSDFREAISRCYVIPSPITSETLRLRERGLLQAEKFSYEWWRQRGFDYQVLARLVGQMKPDEELIS
jgi:hypothetical protein